MAHRSAAMTISIERTKNFFVRYMSRKAAQRGLSDHAIPMLAVASVIWLSECPRSLYMVPDTQITRAKGMPSERYELGTQLQGLRTRVAGGFMRRAGLGGAPMRPASGPMARPRNQGRALAACVLPDPRPGADASRGVVEPQKGTPPNQRRFQP